MDARFKNIHKSALGNQSWRMGWCRDYSSLKGNIQDRSSTSSIIKLAIFHLRKLTKENDFKDLVSTAIKNFLYHNSYADYIINKWIIINNRIILALLLDLRLKQLLL